EVHLVPQTLSWQSALGLISAATAWMHWVRQVPGKGLEWLLMYYSSSNEYFAPGIEDRVTVTKDLSNNIFDLTIKSPRVDDTAIYYCARDSQ
uniref:Immunoglobulin V-set domain-containing protein n=1 Tax=Callorhinchus milii TaxID=7868 RepID=A0A4W3GFM2_CALMI